MSGDTPPVIPDPPDADIIRARIIREVGPGTLVTFHATAPDVDGIIVRIQPPDGSALLRREYLAVGQDPLGFKDRARKNYTKNEMRVITERTFQR